MNENSSNKRNSKYLISAIISIICFIFFTCSIIMRLNGESSTKLEDKIKGCYYIIDDILSDTDTSLCVDGENTVFTYMGKKESTLYNQWGIESSLLIKDEYNNTFFSCSVNREDNNKMECTSYKDPVGYHTRVWEK